MILAGELDKTYITEILHFTLYFEKNGILSCVSKTGDTIRFYLRDGNLEKIINPWEDLKLGGMLYARGYINEKELNRALRQQHELKKQLGEILVQMNLLTRPLISKVLRTQFEEIIFRVAALEEATFALEEFPEEEHRAAFIFSKSEQNILGHIDELNAKVKRFKQISYQLPSNGTLLTRDNEALKANPKVAEKEESRKIIRLADGTRTLQDIRIQCAYNMFDAQSVILNLYKAGILKKA